MNARYTWIFIYQLVQLDTAHYTLYLDSIEINYASAKQLNTKFAVRSCKSDSTLASVIVESYAL
jgi:hypothetical protein